MTGSPRSVPTEERASSVAPSQRVARRRVRRARLADAERVSWVNIRRAWLAYVLLAPVFILLLVFNYYPPVIGLVRAFFEWSPTNPGEPAVFTGLDNFRAYLTYPETPRELINIVKLLLGYLVIRVVVPFLAAELIFAIRSEDAKEVYRLLAVLPMLVPGIVYTLLWKHIYDPALGPVNELLRSAGLQALALDWLGDPRIALYAIMGVGFPWVAGIGTLVYLGGLAQISDSVFDASLLDGCVGLRRIVLIDLPLVLGQVRMLTVLAVVYALTSFGNILVLTRGGPGYATHVPGLTMYYRAFTTGQFGYASAIGLLLFVFTMGLTLLVNSSLRPFAEQI